MQGRDVHGSGRQSRRLLHRSRNLAFYFFQAEAGIRDVAVTGVQTCALRIFLDEYGATNPAEFFAVATECFFEKPRQLKKKHPALYDELKRFYRQDPVNFAWPASPEP